MSSIVFLDEKINELFLPSLGHHHERGEVATASAASVASRSHSHQQRSLDEHEQKLQERLQVPSIYYVRTFSGISDPLPHCVLNGVLPGHFLGIKM